MFKGKHRLAILVFKMKSFFTIEQVIRQPADASSNSERYFMRFSSRIIIRMAECGRMMYFSLLNSISKPLLLR